MLVASVEERSDQSGGGVGESGMSSPSRARPIKPKRAIARQTQCQGSCNIAVDLGNSKIRLNTEASRAGFGRILKASLRSFLRQDLQNWITTPGSIKELLLPLQ